MAADNLEYMFLSLVQSPKRAALATKFIPDVDNVIDLTEPGWWIGVVG